MDFYTRINEASVDYNSKSIQNIFDLDKPINSMTNGFYDYDIV